MKKLKVVFLLSLVLASVAKAEAESSISFRDQLGQSEEPPVRKVEPRMSLAEAKRTVEEQVAELKKYLRVASTMYPKYATLASVEGNITSVVALGARLIGNPGCNALIEFSVAQRKVVRKSYPFSPLGFVDVAHSESTHTYKYSFNWGEIDGRDELFEKNSDEKNPPSEAGKDLIGDTPMLAEIMGGYEHDMASIGLNYTGKHPKVLLSTKTVVKDQTGSGLGQDSSTPNSTAGHITLAVMNGRDTQYVTSKLNTVANKLIQACKRQALE